MHIISRSEHEGLVINNNIRVTVLEIGQTSVRLRIEDPSHQPPVWDETLSFEDDGGSRAAEVEEPAVSRVAIAAAL